MMPIKSHLMIRMMANKVLVQRVEMLKNDHLDFSLFSLVTRNFP
jgi:hypothetical protein